MCGTDFSHDISDFYNINKYTIDITLKTFHEWIFNKILNMNDNWLYTVKNVT